MMIAQESGLKKNRRLFIGVPLDVECQSQLDELLKLFQADCNIRWLPPDNRHLTLAFLGETSEKSLVSLQQYFEGAFPDINPFDFPLRRLERFPDAKGQIIAAVSNPSEELLRIHRQTLVLVEKCGLPVEGRAYRPHVTLGRIRHPGKFDQSMNESISIMLRVNRVNLYESVPTAQGRQYIPLSTFALQDL